MRNGDGRSLEQQLWVAIYVAAVFAPVALLVVAAKPGADGPRVVLAAALGFVAFAVLALQMITSGRWPAITAAFGLRKILAFHREAGMVALALVAGHIAVLMVDDPERVNLLNPLVAPARAQAGMAALVGVALLALTSVMRKRLGLNYERWRAIHITSAVMVVVGSLLHVLGVGAYLSHPAFRWGTLGAVVLALTAIAVMRCTRPFASTRRRFCVRNVEVERGGAVTIDLVPESHRGLRFEPGQYAWLKLARRPYSLDEHPLSLSSSAERHERLSFTVKPVGDFTKGLVGLQVGTPVLLDGPHGEPIRTHRSKGQLLLAAGIGITPAMSLIRTEADRGGDQPLLLLYGNRRWEDVAFREELAALEQAHPKLRVVHALSRPSADWKGERGHVDERLVRDYLPADVAAWHALVCGPSAMVDASVRTLRRFGVRPSAIQAEALT